MATYNCNDSANQAYGTGNYSTCDGQSGQVVGVPNTGFARIISGDAALILFPLFAIVAVTVITMVMKRRKNS